jgi:hypothetical protein
MEEPKELWTIMCDFRSHGSYENQSLSFILLGEKEPQLTA